MKRKFLLLVTVLALLPLLHAQTDPLRGLTGNTFTSPSSLTIKSDVNEVRLAFSATDPQGRVISQLSPSDVVVVDNGETINRVRSFRPAAESPVNLVILVDSSESVASEFPRVIAELNLFFASATWRPEDRVSLVAFGGNWPTLICAWRCADQRARLPLKSIQAGGSTPLYDALVEAAKLISRRQAPDARPAVLLFSDGFDTISLNGAEDALYALERTDAAVYAKSASGRLRLAESEEFLNALTEHTGGLRYPTAKSVDATLAAVLQDVRSGFVLTYELPRTGAEEHFVQLLPANQRGLKIRVRNSYQVPRPQSDYGQSGR